MAEPTRPGEIPGSISLSALVQRRHEHAMALLYHTVTPLSDTERGGHALAELAYTAEVSERVLSGRWVVACEALDAGKSTEQTAAAMGLDPVHGYPVCGGLPRRSPRGWWSAMSGRMVAAGMAGCVVLGISLLGYTAATYDAAGSATATRQFLTVVGVVVAAWVVMRVRLFVRTVGGRQMVVRSEGGHGTQEAATHEGGHVALVKAAGGRVLEARIYPDGSGITRFKLPAGVAIEDVIAIDVAGEVAAGTSRGCESDQAFMRAALASLPANERDAARRAGYARARSVAGGFLFDGGVAATAEKLMRDGRL